jgi:glutaminyl-peptide cyclotransferase
MLRSLVAIITLLLAVVACKNDPKPPTPAPPALPKATTLSPAPTFNADSAYTYVKKQVDFGPRVPNTTAHKKCGAWIAQTFRRHGLTVIEQSFKAPHYKGGEMNGVNIIAQYKPEAKQRVILAAHWDSRFMADQDKTNPDKPVDGADDGASGVGVLLEIARLLKDKPMELGVDLICFDVEDQGNDSDDEQQDNSRTWCLGAQHWSKNQHAANYYAQYGILLDMVGAANPNFEKEGVSMQAAPNIVNKVWNIANVLGYGNAFVSTRGAGITDDHFFVITQANIPMIDIINRPGVTPSGFVAHWHTHNDKMSAIDKNTLKMVGQTCIQVLANTAAGTF